MHQPAAAALLLCSPFLRPDKSAAAGLSAEPPRFWGAFTVFLPQNALPAVSRAVFTPGANARGKSSPASRFAALRMAGEPSPGTTVSLCPPPGCRLSRQLTAGETPRHQPQTCFLACAPSIHTHTHPTASRRRNCRRTKGIATMSHAVLQTPLLHFFTRANPILSILSAKARVALAAQKWLCLPPLGWQ